MNYKTIADVDDGFGDRTPACRECTHPCADSDSRIYAAIPGRTIIGPVLQDHIFTVSWHSWNWTFKFHPRQSQIEIPGRSSAEERIASWMSYTSEIQDTFPRVMNYFWKDLLQKEVNLVLQGWSIEECHAKQFEIPMDPVYYSKNVILLEKGSGMTFLPANLSKETLGSGSLEIGHEIGTSF